jgi:lipoate-protein ligase B
VAPEIEDLGRTPFAAAHARMLELHAAVLRGETEGRILLVEHEPVYTAGRASAPAEVTAGVVPVERGGRVTWHGPGQLVVYPVVPLPVRDVRDWLGRLEQFGVAVCAAFGLQAEPSVDGTGVFVAGRKVVSIGVAIRRWVSLHGIAINVAMDLEPWHAIRPCGLRPEVITDLSRAVGQPVTMAEVRSAVRERILQITQAPRPARRTHQP